MRLFSFSFLEINTKVLQRCLSCNGISYYVYKNCMMSINDWGVLLAISRFLYKIEPFSTNEILGKKKLKKIFFLHFRMAIHLVVVRLSMMLVSRQSLLSKPNNRCLRKPVKRLTVCWKKMIFYFVVYGMPYMALYGMP